MPTGKYAHATKWTPPVILAALTAFHGRTHRLPRGGEWRAAYGLPSRETVARVWGGLAALFAAFEFERAQAPSPSAPEVPGG